MEGRLDYLEQRIAKIEAELALIPMRIFNSSGSVTTPLMYPPGHVRGGALPKTKYDAYAMNDDETLAALQVLDVPNIPDTAPEQIKCFYDYIGLGMPES